MHLLWNPFEINIVGAILRIAPFMNNTRGTKESSQNKLDIYCSEFHLGEHARAAPTSLYVVGAILRLRPLATLKIYKTGSYFVAIPKLLRGLTLIVSHQNLGDFWTRKFGR